MSRMLALVCKTVWYSLTLVMFVGSFSISCNAGNNLSNREAARIITAHLKYPIVISKQVAFRENSREMLHYLKKEGYIVASAAQTCCGAFYATTEKGKPHFGDMIKHFTDGDLYVDCGYARKVIKSIKEILVDTKTNNAMVEYIEGIESNEPVYSAVFMKSREGTEKIDFNETQVKRIKLIYNDKGWRVEGQIAEQRMATTK